MATKLSGYEPPPTGGHVAAAIGDKLYRWGGRGSGQRRNAVDVFDAATEIWECVTTHGPPPLGIENCAYTVIGSSLFTFGGRDGDSRYNSLHQLNIMTMEWRELVPKNPSDAPQKKSGCGMVSLDEDKLVVFAGHTEHSQHTDELHIFDTKKLTWSSQSTSGMKPPPLSYYTSGTRPFHLSLFITGTKPPPLTLFTFTKIDANRAAVFGGNDGKNRNSDVFILDMRKWHWILLDVSKHPKPPVRSYHAACCVASPHTGQELLVVGGEEFPTILSDVWLLDIFGRKWREVALPEALLPRCGHSATVFGSGPDCRQLVLWGGQKSIINIDVIGETTLLNFGLNGGEWKVTSMVKRSQLGKPVERLMEKMEKLWPTPTRATERIASLEERLRRAEEQQKAAEELRRAEEQAKEAKELEEKLRKEQEREAKAVEQQQRGEELLPSQSAPRRGDKPKFRHLKLGFKGKDGTTVRVIRTVAAKWDELAYALDFECHVVNTVRRDNPQDSESACEEVFDRWLSGDLTTRQPVTWATLIQSLRECQQSSLAEDLENALL